MKDRLARAATVADYASTLWTRELHEILRATPTLPLETLINRGAVRFDFDRRRIWRDSYWKGSFARDHPLGWEERLLTPSPSDGSPYAGGRFWKRFDRIEGGLAHGLIVNYGVSFLPGLPVVRQVRYPDARRRYFQEGDDILLLTYTNQPYRLVYDAIKAVGPDSCIGVMHLGTFPRGLEFATFVMSRHNYPFENMAVPDHDALFEGDASRLPADRELSGHWTGRLVFVRHPELGLHNQFNPRVVRASFEPPSTAHIRNGLLRVKKTIVRDAGRVLLTGGSHDHEIRIIGGDTLLGRRFNAGAGHRGPNLRYVLSRR